MKKLMFKMFLMSGLLIVGGRVQAEVYDIDAAHSQVGFRIRHIVSNTKGNFNDFSGTINFDDKKPENLSAAVTIKTASVNTNNAKRDEHLKSADFFNVQKFPEMTFKSTKVKSVGAGKLEIVGDLTMLGATKSVKLMADILGAANDPWGSKRVGFSASGTLNRKDFGMVYNMAMDKGGFVLGDNVEIQIEVEGVAKK